MVDLSTQHDLHLDKAKLVKEIGIVAELDATVKDWSQKQI